MRVVVHPSDRGGCGFYRVISPARALKRGGRDVRCEFNTRYRAMWQPSVFGDRVVGLARPVDADVVVLQRPMHRHRVELIAALQAQGVAVVVEVDDDFHAIHPRNPAFIATRPLEDADHNRDWLKLACERADLVTVTTPALARRYGHHGRVAILPNYVPQSYLALRRTVEGGSRVVVGWSGSTATHPGDLEETGGGVAEALAATGAEFGVVGTGLHVGRALGLAGDPPGTGWVALDRYPRQLAITMDIGIVPLMLTPFNQAKSSLKMLEMASVGIPPVGSPTEANRWAAALGVGELADSPTAWRESVSRLVRDHGYRKAQSDRSYATAQTLTIERNCGQWWDAWGQAVENMRAAA